MITSLVRGAKSATAGCFEEHQPTDQYSSGQSTASNFGYVQVSSATFRRVCRRAGKR